MASRKLMLVVGPLTRRAATPITSGSTIINKVGTSNIGMTTPLLRLTAVRSRLTMVHTTGQSTGVRRADRRETATVNLPAPSPQ